MYKVASPSEYLVITGDVLPGQSFTVFDVSPVNYTFEVQALSAEKLPFLLPAVFTIGPRMDDEPSLLKYAKLISPHDKLSHHVKELVQGIIEGETRVLAASITMEEIFKGTKEFKQEVFEKVQLELNQFKLLIYNANVKQLVDVRGHEHFSYLRQKTQMEVANQAKVDVAEARMKGEIGSKSREGQTLQNAAKIDAKTKIIATQRQGEGKKEEIKVKAAVKVYENEREAEVAEANADLAKKKAGWTKEAQVSEVEAAKAVALREAELQREAEFLSKASVEYETKVQEANWELYKKQKDAEAVLYQKEKEAETQKAMAEAAYYTRQQLVDGELYAKKKEAEGLVTLVQAQGIYLRTLLDALGGSYIALMACLDAIRNYLMINKGMFQEIAKINAEAVQGLKPTISIWTNGTGGEAIDDGSAVGGNVAMKEVAGVYRMLPPLFKTVHDQTGMLPPAWLGTLTDSSHSNLN
ncbi:hypothetical protein ACB092_01G113800 [Castanea dentata]